MIVEIPEAPVTIRVMFIRGESMMIVTLVQTLRASGCGVVMVRRFASPEPDPM